MLEERNFVQALRATKMANASQMGMNLGSPAFAWNLRKSAVTRGELKYVIGDPLWVRTPPRPHGEASVTIENELATVG